MMSYQVLARKWRPRSFEQMVGQELVLRMLTNALDQQRLHHAYLFTGTRGVGKTTLARIIAKCLNCEKGISARACETCDTCQAIDAGKFLDLIEVDAASRTKVEDTRELLENVQYPPTQGRFKIYLIDEVHMLSNHSFNALLKTLEEPPHHVKFLLATTDPKRLPITILSRCLQFNLNRVPVDTISQQLAHICTAENIQFESAALTRLAQAADGSMRDALSLLDQAIAFCVNKINLTDIQRMLGFVEQDILFNLLHALADRNGQQLLNHISQLAERAPNFHQALEELLSLLHTINLAQIIKELKNPDERITALAARFSPEEIQLYYQIALIGRRDLPLAPHPHQGFEMTLLRMLAFQPTGTATAAPPSASPTPATQNWPAILPKLELSGMALALASHCELQTFTDKEIVLTLAEKHATLINKKLIERIEQALSSYLKHPIKLDIQTAKHTLNTPAHEQQQEENKRREQATVRIQKDTQVKKMIELFDATLDLNSIQNIDPPDTST